MTTKVMRCSERVYDGSRVDFGGHSCSRKGIIERNGELWCKQHDPEEVAARREAQSAKWQAEYDAQEQLRRSAVALAVELGVGLPEYSAYTGKGRYTGGIILTAEEAQRVIRWLEALRRGR